MAIAIDRRAESGPGQLPGYEGTSVYQRMQIASGLSPERFAAAVKEGFTIGNVIDLGTSLVGMVQNRKNEATSPAVKKARPIINNRVLPLTAAAGLLVAFTAAATQNETVMHTAGNAKSQADNLVGTVLANEFIAPSPPEIGYEIANESYRTPGSMPGQPTFVGSRLMLDQMDILDRLQNDPDASFSISVTSDDPTNPLITTNETVFAYQNGRQTVGQDLESIFLPESEAVDGNGGPFLPLLHSYTEPVELLYQEQGANGGPVSSETTASLQPDIYTHIAPTDTRIGVFLVAANDEVRTTLSQALSGSSDQLQYALDVLPPQFLTGNIYVATDSDFASDESFTIIEDGVIIRQSVLEQLQEPQKQQYILEAMLASSLSRVEITDENIDDIYREISSDEVPHGPTAKATLRDRTRHFARQIDLETNDLRTERRRFYNAIDDALGITEDRRMLEDENYKNADLFGARVLTLMALDIEKTASFVNPRETEFNSVNRIDDLKKVSDAAFIIIKSNASKDSFVTQEALDGFFGWGMSALQYHGLIDETSWAYNNFIPYLDDPAIKAARLAALRSAGLSHSDVAYWAGSPDGGAVSAGWSQNGSGVRADSMGQLVELQPSLSSSTIEYLLTHGPFSQTEIPEKESGRENPGPQPR